MRTKLTVGIRADSLEDVSGALSRITGATPEAHESSYLGEYYLFHLPESLMVKFNFVAEEDEYDFPTREDLEVIAVAGNTDRPDHLEQIIAQLGFEYAILEKKAW